MVSFYSKYSSFDDFYDTMFRGNEIEFKYDDKLYYVLPYFHDNEISGIMFGESAKEQNKICLTKNELYYADIGDSFFGEILSDIDIVWCNM